MYRSEIVKPSERKPIERMFIQIGKVEGSSISSTNSRPKEENDKISLKIYPKIYNLKTKTNLIGQSGTATQQETMVILPQHTYLTEGTMVATTRYDLLALLAVFGWGTVFDCRVFRSPNFTAKVHISAIFANLIKKLII